MEDGQPILWVARESDDHEGEDWSVLCGASDHAMDDLSLVHLAHLVRSAPSLRQLARMALNEAAERTDVDATWVKTRLV